MQRSLSQQISQFHAKPSVDPDAVCVRIISRAVIQLIQRQPLYGIIMAKLSREANSKLSSPLGLTWQRHHLVLLYNPKEFLKQIKTGKELLFWLEHEALHLIYFHPVRYPRTNWITQVATDVTVNQAIPGRIPNELTLSQINRRYGLKLPSNVNSQFYVTELTKFFNQQKRGHDYQISNQKIKKALNRTDDHHFWGSEPQLSRQAKTLQLKRLIQRSYQNTTAKSRGTLPGKVNQRLKRISLPTPINWRAYVKVGLGGVPFGRKTSRARFNRRQAYRMDLMGTVSNYVQPVSVFVDNSGSMGDAEISYLLAQLGAFLKRFPVKVDVYSFDSEVHGAKRYQANNFHQLRFVRIGGGGTRFQSIFDYAQRRLHTNRNRLMVILTDGYGESHLNYYGFSNILWILTQPKKNFSVKNQRGQVISVFNDPNLNVIKNK